MGQRNLFFVNSKYVRGGQFSPDVLSDSLLPPFPPFFFLGGLLLRSVGSFPYLKHIYVHEGEKLLLCSEDCLRNVELGPLGG